MLLDTHKISLIYDFWKLNNEENYLNDITEFSRRLIDSDTIDVEYLRKWIPDLVHIVELWEHRLLCELDQFYISLLKNTSYSDKVDALLRFLYDIQSYDMVKYLLEKNVEHYQKQRLVSWSMNAFHESCIYGFSHVCLLFIDNGQNVNQPFSLTYENRKSNKRENVRNLTGLQLACLWSRYFPKRFQSYAHTVRLLLNHGARVNMTSTELTTPLHWACRAKHTTQLAQDLIEYGASITARDKFNIQPIHYACWARNKMLVEFLISKGAQLMDTDDFGRTPMHFLCMPIYTESITMNDRQHQYDLMEFILNSHKTKMHLIDLNKQDLEGNTLLAYACVSQNDLLMKLLLQYEPNLLNKVTVYGRTPLIISIDEGFIEGVEYLLEHKNLDRNQVDVDGNTAVHHACTCTKISLRSNLLQLLINDKNGMFDFEKRNEKLIDPFMLCVINQSIDLCTLLMQKHVLLIQRDIYSRQSLHIACQIGNYELVSLLLKSTQINVNSLDNADRNCLFYALNFGNENIINLLIEHNINIQIHDIVGDNPLHVAVQHPTNAYQLTKCLINTNEGKSLINQPAADSMTPILLAASCKQADVIYLLIKYGANVHAMDTEHRTALHLACKNNCIRCVFYLIEFTDLNINQLDIYEQTPLFYAYASNNYDLVEYLLTSGAKLDNRDNQNYLPIHMGILLSKSDQDYDLNLIDLYKNKYDYLLDDQDNRTGMTLLMLACTTGRLNVVEYLIKNCKVNIMSKCSNGHTTLHYACLYNTPKSIDIIELLIEAGCSYENVDQPKGSFLFSIVRHGDRQAAMYFIDYWLKRKSDINELLYGSTILDLLYDRAQLQYDEINAEYVRNLLEQGACFSSYQSAMFPCPLVNNCPSFYLTLLEYNCPSFQDKNQFILHLLYSISIHSDNYLLLNRESKEYIGICEYFFLIVRYAHYYYSIEDLYSIIDQQFIPHLKSRHENEQTEKLCKKLNDLRSMPLKLSEISRKLIRMKLELPIKTNFQQIDLPKHLLQYLLQNNLKSF